MSTEITYQSFSDSRGETGGSTFAVPHLVTDLHEAGRLALEHAERCLGADVQVDPTHVSRSDGRELVAEWEDRWADEL